MSTAQRVTAPSKSEPTRAPARSLLSPLGAARWSRSGETAEREAGDLAGAVMRGGAACTRAPEPTHDEAPTGGRALSAETRAFFEPRFGVDFSRVRVFSDEQASEAARNVGALAYTMGRQIVWGAPAAPESPAARPILAHELAHLAASHTVAEPGTVFRQPATRAVLPREDQRREVLEIFNKQQAQDPDVDPVADPDAFVAALKVRARVIRASTLTRASAVQSAPVRLEASDLTDVIAIAEEEIRAAFGSYLAAGVDLSAVRARIRYFPADPGTAPAPGEATLSAEALEGLALAAIRVGISQDTAAQAIIATHRVIPGGRDEALFQRALEAIHAENPAAWRTIGLSVRGMNSADMTLLQRRIVPESGEPAEQARRRGRWMNLGTAIHEMLHAVTHPDFPDAVRGTEQGDLGVEGFTEFFTRGIYEDIKTRASSDAALRLRIEGTAGPAFTPPPRTSYETFFAAVKEILGKLEGNEENLRQAYFRGRVEYIGLGRWNELSRGLPTARRHDIGAAVMLQAKGGSLAGDRPYARASYGYLVWGHSGAVQVDLRGGAGITFLGEGQRLGLGPDLSLTLRGNHLFLTGGALLQGSASLAGSGGGDLRADMVFRVAFGAQIGSFHVGLGADVLVPINEPDAARRGARAFAGLGASFVFGR